MTIIEQFAIDKFDVHLTPYQMTLIKAWTENKTFLAARASGKATAQKVIRAYVADAFKEKI